MIHKRINIKAARVGDKVRNPATGRHLADKGETVVQTSYWLRRIADGDVIYATEEQKQPAKEPAKESADEVPAEDIIAALETLDPEDESAWTKNGLPELAALESILQKSLKRAQVKAAAPDFDRDQARAKRAS